MAGTVKVFDPLADQEARTKVAPTMPIVEHGEKVAVLIADKEHGSCQLIETQPDKGTPAFKVRYQPSGAGKYVDFPLIALRAALLALPESSRKSIAVSVATSLGETISPDAPAAE